MSMASQRLSQGLFIFQIWCRTEGEASGKGRSLWSKGIVPLASPLRLSGENGNEPGDAHEIRQAVSQAKRG